jgi:acetyltransferase-like isoleucine patch superfamily enzyme
MIKWLKKLRDLYLVKVKWRRHTIGSGFHAGARVVLWSKHSMVIGNNFYIGRDSQIECDAVIGNDVIIANKVGIIGKYDHNYQEIGIPVRRASQIRDKEYNWKGLDMKVVIDDDAWIGYGAIVLCGVTIGRGSIVAAGSVVTRDVDPYCIYAGNPAKKITDRFGSEEDKKRHIDLYYGK